jgi:phage/plasmid-like protein (TIGR03299 family)
MAHELSFDFATGEAEMAYVGEKPWHGYGQKLQEGLGIEEWARAAHMDWQILEAPALFSPDGTDPAPVPGRKVLYRSDSHLPLSVVSNRYQAVQPIEVLDFFRDLTEQMGYQLETAGVLREGRNFWALARTGMDSEVTDGDKVAPYLLLATSCDSTLATTARMTTIRVVCANTLAISAEHSSVQCKYLHSSKFDARQCKRDLGLLQAQEAFDAFIAKAKKLANVPVSFGQAEDVAKRIMLIDDDAKHSGLDKVMALFSGGAKGADMAGQTAWGLLNAVTEYVDHHGRKRSDDLRQNSAWFGAGASIKQRAEAIITDLIAA